MTDADQAAASVRLDLLWQMVQIVEFDESLMVGVAKLAVRFSLRAYDAVQCASALRFGDAELPAVAGDRLLPDAWGLAGLAVVDTNRPRGNKAR